MQVKDIFVFFWGGHQLGTSLSLISLGIFSPLLLGTVLPQKCSYKDMLKDF